MSTPSPSDGEDSDGQFEHRTAAVLTVDVGVLPAVISSAQSFDAWYAMQDEHKQQRQEALRSRYKGLPWNNAPRRHSLRKRLRG